MSKAKPIPQVVWEGFRLRVKKAYVDDRWTQKELRERFNPQFTAPYAPSKAQWKSQLAIWGFTRRQIGKSNATTEDSEQDTIDPALLDIDFNLDYPYDTTQRFQ
ncbi:MAG: hypothetical protein M1812_006732 [Candelaria pacifica]|nr:MAG: hypothetical protein M1812_006732 [Candelaria pacifica]